jgi:hypothetical protein
MLVSRYSEFVICGGTKTFDEFVSEFLNCSVDGENYFQNYYAQILQVFENDFSTHNVLLLLQENLRGNEEATIRQLSEFLGIEERRPYSRGVISRRVGLSKLGIKVVRALNRKTQAVLPRSGGANSVPAIQDHLEGHSAN